MAIVLDLEPDVQVVWTAENGRTAVQLAAEEPADVILTDLRMPDFDGVQVIQHIRARGVGSVFIVLTTFHQDEWLIDDGDTNAEIAQVLRLSEGTVKNYVSTLYAKLGVRHRAEAIHLRQRGLVLFNSKK